MKYPLSEKYNTPELMVKIMGPNPMKLEEELLTGHKIPAGSVVCDLGSGLMPPGCLKSARLICPLL